jgi:hypothetical protein
VSSLSGLFVIPRSARMLSATLRLSCLATARTSAGNGVNRAGGCPNRPSRCFPSAFDTGVYGKTSTPACGVARPAPVLHLVLFDMR